MIEQIEKGAEMLVTAGFEPAGVIVHLTQFHKLMAKHGVLSRQLGARAEVLGLPIFVSNEIYGPVVVSTEVLGAMRRWSRPRSNPALHEQLMINGGVLQYPDEDKVIF